MTTSETIYIPSNTLIKYVRNKKRNPRGVILSLKLPNGQHSIGWSLCCPKDTFDKRQGILLAMGRAVASMNGGAIPHSIRGDIEEMKKRAARYYKN